MLIYMADKIQQKPYTQKNILTGILILKVSLMEQWCYTEMITIDSGEACRHFRNNKKGISWLVLEPPALLLYMYYICIYDDVSLN